MPDREIKIVLAVLLAFILYFYGAVSASFKSFPYTYIEPAVHAAEGVGDAMNIAEYSREIRWARPALSRDGLVLKDEARGGGQGYTVFSTTHDTKVRMVDENGKIVHEWPITYSAIWDNQDHILSMSALDDDFFYARDFHVYPNGDLLVMIAASGVTPWGMGLAKLDKDGAVLWAHRGYTNNDFEVAPDGTIYVVEHEIEYEDLEYVDLPSVPFLEDHIVHLDSDGKELGRVSLIKAIEASPYKDLLKQLVKDEEGDPTHSNSIEYIRQTRPDVPWMKAGHLLISVRNISAMVVFDPVNEVVTYAGGLPARQQHDIDVLQNGHLLVFDNQGSFTDGGYSRVVELDPVSLEIIWNYDPAPSEDVPEFENRFWGNQQRLANGHTLISHTEAGRIIEVAPDKSLVWDYRAPLALEVEGQKMVAAITTATRVSAQDVLFLK